VSVLSSGRQRSFSLSQINRLGISIVEIGGLLLCKTPEEFVAQRNLHYQKQTANQMEAVDSSLMRQSDPRMPLFKESKSTTTFGKG
jgi:hypothetical protein